MPTSLLTRPRAHNGITWCQPPRTLADACDSLQETPGVKRLVEERAGSRNVALKYRKRGFNAECKRNDDGTYKVFAWWPV